MGFRNALARWRRSPAEKPVDAADGETRDARGSGPAWRVRTPSVLQMEAVECGAAALAIVLGYYDRVVPLEEMRLACGVSRDGSTAKNLLAAARKYGFVAKGWKKELDELREITQPAILFWNFNHFLVVEGMSDKKVWLNDPASGRRATTWDEVDTCFSGVVLTFERGPEFTTGGERPSVVRNLAKRLRGSERALAFLVLAGLGMVLPGLVVPIFSKIFVDNYLISHLEGWFRPLLVAMTVTLLLRGTLGWLQQRYILRLQTKLLVSTSTQFFEHVLRLPVEFFSQRYAGDVSNRVGLNDQVALFLSRQLASSAIAAMLVLFYAVLMLFYSPPLTLIGIGVVVAIVLLTRFVGRLQSDGSRRLLQEQSKVAGVAMGGLSTIETLKATGGESDLFARWAGYMAKTVTVSQELERTSDAFLSLPPLLTQVTNIAILAAGGYFVMQGSLTMGALVAFQTLMSSFLGPVNALVGMASGVQRMDGNMGRLDDVLRYNVDPQTAPRAADDDPALAGGKLRGEVELRNVTFGYSRLSPPLIENFSLYLKPGSRVALVGGSGSGKSTIAKLVSGLYPAWSGEVLFDGVPPSQIPRRVFTASVSVVDQDISMFEGTIRDSLTLWDRTVPDPDVLGAGKDALIHNEITSRTGGYQSAVAEGGSNFSGGQRQRLEIARALVGNPRILILDEATSALDTLTEQRIDQHLRRRGCTCIIVAHRLSTIRDADEIIVLHKGKVVQRGNHESLMREPEGPYAKLVKA